MTRINCIPPAELISKHLVAEYRELPRVFGLVRNRVKLGHTPENIDIPDEYTLGIGHVKFFYDKLLWLSWRHIHLVNEMESRGYNPNFTCNLRVVHRDIPTLWWNDWKPTDDAKALNRERIAQRLKK